MHQLALAQIQTVDFVTAASRRLETQYIEGTRAGAPVLVFLHEGLGSVQLWKSFPSDLVRATGCPALVYSRYGNGFSEILEQDRGVGYMHDEALIALPDLLDRNAIRETILIGHSDGASIALIFAGLGDAPVRAVVAEAPHVFVEDISVVSIARAKVLYETTDLRERLAQYHQDVDRTFFGWNDIWLDPSFRSWDIREYTKGTRAPMLLVQGAQDEYGTQAQLQAIREDAQGPVDAIYLANCGHAPHRDRGEFVTAAVAAFIQSVL